jgi:hypothetical protein
MQQQQFCILQVMLLPIDIRTSSFRRGRGKKKKGVIRLPLD